MKTFKVSVVVPGYNEADNIPRLMDTLLSVLSPYQHFEIIFVDDGSADATTQLLQQLNQADVRINYISLSRNFGHQNALKAGLDHSSGDCVISMDADLQHPPSLIPELIAKWQEGYDIVYTRRKEDKKLPIFKRKTSSIFYKLINYFGDLNIEEGTADFRLMDSRAVMAFRSMNENDLFIRGLVSWLGFKQYKIDYHPAERFAGTTKYSVKKMFSFATKGITSFSIKPLRLSALLGFSFSVLAFLYGIYAIYGYFFSNRVVSGWTSVVMSVLFMGGIQLIILGVIGEYLGKLFIQAKNRPLYIIRDSSIASGRK